MNKEDIVNVVKIMRTADGGCGVCASRLVQKLLIQYPQHEIDMLDAWQFQYDDPNSFSDYAGGEGCDFRSNLY